ncbi:MAG: ABC transporter permease [Symbiobacteriaceae bacterium]|nr:ABC transporter permease [Symbiobacteriaceae bacterium]
MNEQIASILRLSWRNIIRWRWRLLVISLLIGLTGSLYILYGGLIISSTRSGMARISPLDLPNYDTLILLGEGETMYPDNILPRPRYSRNILQKQEGVKLLQLDTLYGSLRTLVHEQATTFYRASAPSMEGRLPRYLGEVALPEQWATRYGFTLGSKIVLSYSGSPQITTQEVEVVGIIPHEAYPVALITWDTLKNLAPNYPTNAILIQINHQEATIAHLVEWLTSVYPRAIFINTQLPQLLGGSMLQQAYTPTSFLMFLIFLFMGVGVLTIALITFLERRVELATLKAVGISNNQTVQLFATEYIFTEGVGLVITLVTGTIFLGSVAWLKDLNQGELSGMVLRGAIYAVVVLVMGIMYPIVLAKVATVNQLLYARTIPLQVREINYVRSATGDLVLREREENIRILRIPYDSGLYICILLKAVGDRVKMGEIIASEELYQGHLINNFHAVCDGTVIGFQGALVMYKPDDPDAPRFPYPESLVTDELHRREIMRQAIENTRKELAEKKE